MRVNRDPHGLFLIPRSCMLLRVMIRFGIMHSVVQKAARSAIVKAAVKKTCVQS